MPYETRSDTVPVTVQAVTLTLDTPGIMWCGGRFSLVVTAPELPDYEEIIFYRRKPGEVAWVEIGRDIIISQKTTLRWDATYDLGCLLDVEFQAYHAASGVYSNVELADVYFQTEIDISAPAIVTAGVPFEVLGKLEYNSAPGAYSPLVGRPVELSYDGIILGTVTTGSDGSYRKTDCIITGIGTKTLEAYYAGEGWGLPRFAVLNIEVPPVIVEYGMVALAAAPFLAVLATIAVNELWR